MPTRSSGTPLPFLSASAASERPNCQRVSGPLICVTRTVLPLESSETSLTPSSTPGMPTASSSAPSESMSPRLASAEPRRSLSKGPLPVFTALRETWLPSRASESKSTVPLFWAPGTPTATSRLPFPSRSPRSANALAKRDRAGTEEQPAVTISASTTPPAASRLRNQPSPLSTQADEDGPPSPKGAPTKRSVRPSPFQSVTRPRPPPNESDASNEPENPPLVSLILPAARTLGVASIESTQTAP